MTRWLVRNGEDAPLGPVTTEVVRSALRAGRLSPSSQVCVAGEQRWQPVSAIPELCGADENEQTPTGVTRPPWLDGAPAAPGDGALPPLLEATAFDDEPTEVMSSPLEPHGGSAPPAALDDEDAPTRVMASPLTAAPPRRSASLRPVRPSRAPTPFPSRSPPPVTGAAARSADRPREGLSAQPAPPPLSVSTQPPDPAPVPPAAEPSRSAAPASALPSKRPGRTPPPLPVRGAKAQAAPQADGRPLLLDAEDDENSGEQPARIAAAAPPAASPAPPVRSQAPAAPRAPAPPPTPTPAAAAAPAPSGRPPAAATDSFEPPARATAKAAAHRPPTSAAPADHEASIIVADDETESTSQRRAARSTPTGAYSDPWLRLLLALIVVLSIALAVALVLLSRR